MNFSDSNGKRVFAVSVERILMSLLFSMPGTIKHFVYQKHWLSFYAFSSSLPFWLLNSVSKCLLFIVQL